MFKNDDPNIVDNLKYQIYMWKSKAINLEIQNEKSRILLVKEQEEYKEL